MHMEKIALIGIPETSASIIRRIGTQLHLRITEISPEAYQTPLGTLLGYTTMHTTPVAIPQADSIAPQGILLLCGLKNSLMDRLLLKLQQYDLQQLYKAVLTTTNAGWNALQLSYELVREREKMRQ